LPDGESEIFLREGLDKGFRKSGSDLPVGQFAVTNYGVASGSSLSLVRAGLGMVGLDRFFGAHIYAVEMVAREKPAPDFFLHAATQIGAPPPDCVVIEDSVAGVIAARAAGAGGGHCGPQTPIDLKQAGAEQVTDDIRNLPSIIASLRRTDAPSYSARRSE
jgi:beta-phosphoglucomutase-like phosphatase (HAD superfamily)